VNLIIDHDTKVRSVVPVYYPVQTPVELRASESDMLEFHWTSRGVIADFVIPSDPTQALRVTFDKQCIVRLLDEMPLSTESDQEPNQGQVAEHFAYRVEKSAFEAAQSEAWKFGFRPVSHWRFITGWTCLDVLSGASPLFSIAPRASE